MHYCAQLNRLWLCCVRVEISRLELDAQHLEDCRSLLLCVCASLEEYLRDAWLDESGIDWALCKNDKFDSKLRDTEASSQIPN